MRKLKQKINEALASVIPITLIVFILSITIAPLPLGMMLMFLAGALLLVAGMGFFALGAELSMMPIGEGAGSELVKSRRLPIMILVTFAMGVIITAAEPDLTASSAGRSGSYFDLDSGRRCRHFSHFGIAENHL